VLYNISHQRPLSIGGSLKSEKTEPEEVVSSGDGSDDDTQSEGSTPQKRKFHPIPKPKGKKWPAAAGEQSVSSTTPSAGKSAKPRKSGDSPAPSPQPSPEKEGEEGQKKPKKPKSLGSMDKLRKAMGSQQ
jgi:hypothetical protein